MEFTRLDESDTYRQRREELRVAEQDLIDQVERVAALRRALPDDTPVADYELIDVRDGRRISLSELFTAPTRALIMYHLMYGKAQTEPCPLCTMWVDGLDAVAPHLERNVDLVVVAAAEPAALAEHAATRGWTNVRLLSAGDSTLKYDLGSEDADGAQIEWVSVFTLAGDGTVHHRYSRGATLAEDRRERGIDLLSPVWHVLDLTPAGRGDWYPTLAPPR